MLVAERGGVGATAVGGTAVPGAGRTERGLRSAMPSCLCMRYSLLSSG